MPSRKISTPKTNAPAFTLMEVLIVLGIIALVAGVSLVMSMDSFHETTFRSERDTVVALLEQARGQAMSNICVGSCTDGKAHGFAVTNNSYIVFQGDTFATSDQSVAETLPRNTNVSVDLGGLPDVVFNQLSGDATTPATIVVQDSFGNSSTITVNQLGEVSWTN